jgi:hypothetical protein
MFCANMQNPPIEFSKSSRGRGIKENFAAKLQFTRLLLGSAAVDPGQQL